MELAPVFPSVIDNSTLKLFATCERKGFWGGVNKLISSGTNVHLHAGGAYAKGMEVMRKAYYAEGKDFETARRDGFLALTKAYGDFEPEDKSPKSWYNVAQAYLAYLKYYPPETDIIRPHVIGGMHQIEFSFALPIPITHPVTLEPLIYAGRFDMIGYDGTALWVVDDKTTGAMGKTWPEQWDMTSQMTGYVWACHQYGIPVGGALIRGVSVQVKETKHLQVPTFRPEWRVQRWYEEMLQTVERFRQAFIDNNFPTTGEFNGACSSYGTCIYKRLCEAKSPQEWLDPYYEISTWSPINSED